MASRAGRYRVFCAETFDESQEIVSSAYLYDLKHTKTFGHPPLRGWLSEWNITVRRMALLRAPIIWC